MTAAVQVPISPNYMSSGLFPMVKSREDSDIGMMKVERPPLGGQVWGTESTRYGGIGALPFQGKVKVKDLPVARSHRHFGNGIDNFRAVMQPHDVTSLMLSECRLNDQLLPPVGTVNFDLRKCHVGPILQDVPYSTHKERSEIFPRGPNEDKTEGQSKFPLCKATREALSNYNQNLYNRSTYAVSWGQDANASLKKRQTTCTPYSAQAAAIPLLKKLPEIKREHLQPSSETGLSPSRSKHGKTKRVRFADLENNYCVGNACRGNKAGKKQLGGLSPCWPPSVYRLDKTFQIKEDLERFPIKTSNNSDQVNKRDEADVGRRCDEEIVTGVDHANAAGNGTCLFRNNGHWGPSNTCLNTLCEKVGVSCSYCAATFDGAKPTTVCKRLAAFEEWKKRIQNTGPPQSLIPSLHGNDNCLDAKQNVEETEENEDDASEEFKDEDFYEDTNKWKAYNSPEPVENEDTFQSVCTAHLRLPRQPFPTNPLFEKPEIRKIPLPPVPLSECLLRSGDRIPCRLGLRFKTEAYKRFHAVHPDTVPDLRKPHNERKCYFFFGHHSTEFRG